MPPRIAICFFGITRSLSHTIDSIRKNVIEPAKEAGSVRIYSHFFRLASISNPRSEENGTLDPDEHQLLKSNWLDFDEPDNAEVLSWLYTVKTHGDPWKDDFRSLKNLAHQLHSLRKATSAALAEAPDVTIFCRPDLEYIDKLSGPIRRAVNAKKASSYLPYWQPWGGLNDRFAICSGVDAARAYGCRIEDALDYCAHSGRALHAEALVYHSLQKHEIIIHQIRHRATRVRFNGNLVKEDFRHPLVVRIENRLRMLLGQQPGDPSESP